MKCDFCEELDHLQVDCPKVQKADNDVEKNEASEAVNSNSNANSNLDSDSDSDSKKSKPKKRPLLKKKSSVIFICYTLSFLNGAKLCNPNSK